MSLNPYLNTPIFKPPVGFSSISDEPIDFSAKKRRTSLFRTFEVPKPSADQLPKPCASDKPLTENQAYLKSLEGSKSQWKQITADTKEHLFEVTRDCAPKTTGVLCMLDVQHEEFFRTHQIDKNEIVDTINRYQETKQKHELLSAITCQRLKLATQLAELHLRKEKMKKIYDLMD